MRNIETCTRYNTDPELMKQASAGRRLYYLSGSPRVSTHPHAETSGARSHMLGVIKGFEQLGWDVSRFIVGDHVPGKWTRSGSQRAISGSYPRRLAADVVRWIMGRINARRANRMSPPSIDWVYERFGAFQSLGRGFQRLGVPWILETNGIIYKEAKHVRKSMALSGLARSLEVKAYRECDVLVCVSEQLKAMICEEVRIPADKVVVTPNGVDTEFYDPGRFRATRLTNDFVVGFVGNLYAWAGVDLLLDAIHELRHEGFPVATVIVGDGMLRSELEERAAFLGVGPHVTFVGRQPRDLVPNYTLGFDVGYSGQTPKQMGTMYGSPIKIYEYLALGKPVIASAYEDARAVIKDGVNGFLFEPASLDGLKQAIVRAYHARAALPSEAERIREGVVSRHSWKARIAGMIEEVELLLRTRGARA